MVTQGCPRLVVSGTGFATAGGEVAGGSGLHIQLDHSDI